MTTRPRLDQVAITLVAFSALLAFVVFWPLTTDNLAFRRTHATAWAMTLLATPALYLFARTYGREPLTNWWRLFWTAGFVMACVHFYYGLFRLHDGDALSVFARQGWLLAGTIFLMMGLWAWDVATAWAHPEWEEDEVLSRRPTFWVSLAAIFISTVLFNNDAPSLIVGLIMAGAVLLALYQRVDALDGWRDFFDSPTPPAVLGAVLVSAALFGPALTSTSADQTAVRAAQAAWTVWPALLLGGIAAALFIAKAPGRLFEWGWPGWQMAGAASYLVHVYAGFGLYFDWSFSAMLTSQGWLVASANLALAVIWTASALAAWAELRVFSLHVASTTLFAAATLLSTWDRPGPVVWFGAALCAIWALAAAARLLRPAR